jgi:hypothetical protein
VGRWGSDIEMIATARRRRHALLAIRAPTAGRTALGETLCCANGDWVE